MEENNIMTIEETENTTEVMDYCDVSEDTSSEGSLVGSILKLAVPVAALVGGAIVVKRAMMTDEEKEAAKEAKRTKKMAKLAKKAKKLGCVVAELEEVKANEVEDSDPVEETE